MVLASRQFAVSDLKSRRGRVRFTEDLQEVIHWKAKKSFACIRKNIQKHSHYSCLDEEFQVLSSVTLAPTPAIECNITCHGEVFKNPAKIPHKKPKETLSV